MTQLSATAVRRFDQFARSRNLPQLPTCQGEAGHRHRTGVVAILFPCFLIARRIAGEPIDHPLFDDRFPAIPMYAGDPWFLPLVGAYYQVRDWLQ